MKTLTVDLGARRYPIHIGSGLLERVADFLPKDATQVIVITDEDVAKHQSLALDAPTITIPAGEASKSFASYQRVCEEILALGIDRKAVLVAFGGGVIGDLSGFVAATLLRGLRFVQVPTTLLAQVDSSVGGKTAINSEKGKNLVGAFHQPTAVVIDPDTLQTLSKDQWLSGYAEVIKVALIRDLAFFSWLDERTGCSIEGDDLVHMIATSCAIKADIVAADERESGTRMLLNLGHTFGHALEAHNGYGSNLPHGFAVGIGVVMAARLSQRLGHLSEQDVAKIEEHMTKCGLMTRISQIPDFPSGLTPERHFEMMRHDKKAERGQLRLILLKAIGEGFVTDDVSEEAVLEVLKDG